MISKISGIPRCFNTNSYKITNLLIVNFSKMYQIQMELIQIYYNRMLNVFISIVIFDFNAKYFCMIPVMT